MFDQFKAMGQIAALMKNREKLREAADRVKDRLDASEVQGESGGGAVRCVVSGTMRVRQVRLDPQLAMGMAHDEKTRELASELIAAAVNDGLAKAFLKARETIQGEAKSMGLDDIGPLTDLLGGSGMGNPFGGPSERRR